MAVSAGAPPGLEAELASDPAYVQAVRDGQQPVALSDYLDLGKGGPTRRSSSSRSSPTPARGCW